MTDTFSPTTVEAETFVLFSNCQQNPLLQPASGIVTNYESGIYDVRRNRATQLVEVNECAYLSDIYTSA